ncbi:MAG: hypothetical protein H0V30_14865 [Chitinophagaceae bacterium]|jgi:hypothetical protein|nr:hypothetical protein [Chitinophagaceae bacterium]
MQTTWLRHFIYNTQLINYCHLTKPEKKVLEKYIRYEASIALIAQEEGLSEEKIKSLLENGMGKILFFVKNVLSKSDYAKQMLDSQNSNT